MIASSDLDDYIANAMEDKIYDFTEDGKCSNCGGCCTRLLPMNAKEIKLIHKYIQEHHIKPNENNFLDESCFDMTCPFRDNIGKICKIYPVRPKICRLFLCNNEIKAKCNRDLVYRTRNTVDVRIEFYGG